MTDNPLRATSTLSINMPLFIRLLEWAREDAPDDLALHRAAEKAMAMRGVLDMDDYKRIVGR